jgi:hypothetical protein
MTLIKKCPKKRELMITINSRFSIEANSIGPNLHRVEQQIGEEPIELNQNTSRKGHPNRRNHRGRRQISWHSYCSKQK